MRTRLEQVLRTIVIVVLALMLWQSLRPPVDTSGDIVRARGLGRGALGRWSAMAKAPTGIQLQLDSVPSPYERAWLRALAGAGSRVTWSGDLAPVMIGAEPVAAPTGGTRVLVAAPRGSSVTVSDEIGVIDTLRPQNLGASLTLGAPSDRVSAHVKSASASTTQDDSVLLRKVLVIGAAGWESKFVVAGLEEEGWKVDALIRLAPGVDVTQGSAAIDTARYSAVIALDSTAAPYANRIVEFVRNGGGALLEPSAASLDAFSALRAGVATRAPSETTTPAPGSTTLATLPQSPITSLRPDAIPIAKKGTAVSIAARRFDAGRVLQLGYDDTWRWRMTGGESAVQDHRRWWTGLVSSVAYAPRFPLPTSRLPLSASRFPPPASRPDPAPVADLVANIGPAMSVGLMSKPRTSSDSTALLFAILVASLIAEVASRRLRGAA